MPTQIHAVRWRDAWHKKPQWMGIWYRQPKRNGGLLRAFHSKERAEAYRLFAERKRRELAPKVNPFWLLHSYTLSALTRFDEPILFDWITDCGLEPPKFPEKLRWESEPLHLWYDWWGKTVRRAEPEARRKVWEAFDRVDFYEVVTVPVLEKVL